ncbi:response regulator [Fimbriiglobus ruber]|uniref:Response regulator receiver modulated diguanylate cyclase n=1 Tax=Fimbriiglobus ruber TaxID=1908690 RepID=A0A225D6Z3_9BACT|nr:response regulator [Fimbriiglobus ruber]OWK37341.1 response regulator receiver modulated diguanylate cyclase [Fimbriiglobus ruber]
MNRTRPYVLVVDDSPDTADSMAELLAIWGYDAEPCYCGSCALAAVHDRRPAAILLDIAMAPMDGFTFAAHFRGLPDHEQTAVVVITGHTSATYQARGRELGIVHYLLKPVDLCLLEALLERLVGEFELPNCTTNRSPLGKRSCPGSLCPAG